MITSKFRNYDSIRPQSIRLITPYVNDRWDSFSPQQTTIYHFIMSYDSVTLEPKVVRLQVLHRLTYRNYYSNQQTQFFNIVYCTLCPKRRHYSVT